MRAAAFALVLVLAGCGTNAAADGSPPAPAGSPSSLRGASPSPSTQTLRYDLDHTSSCAALAANFTYISVSTITTMAGQTYVTYQPATMHCGGPDDYQYVTEPGVHHVYVDDDAEVVVMDETDNPTPVASSARELPAAFARSHQPIFAIRHSSTGHASA